VSRVRACLFDAYGTLFDVHSAVASLAPRVGLKSAEVSALWRQRQIEYSWFRTMVGRHADFATVTAEALDYALAVHGIVDNLLRADLLAAYRCLSAYPEVPSMLDQLRAAGLKTGVLSNGAPEMLSAAIAAAGLDRRFDAVISVESIGAFKVDRRVYQHAVEAIGLPAQEIAFQSSNAWDAAAAADFGFVVHWINRAGLPREYEWAGPATELKDLSALPSAIRL
jgi:2-haloacid dehalogenase